MLKGFTTLVLCTAMLAGCGRFSGWLSPSSANRGPTTLEPKDGYPTSADEYRQLMPSIASARFEATNEGNLLVVVANAPTKGWWDIGLITEIPQPAGRYRPDENGVLRLRLVGNPPPANSAEARMAADPRVDSIAVALPLSHIALAGVTRIEVTSAQNTVALNR